MSGVRRTWIAAAWVALLAGYGTLLLTTGQTPLDAVTALLAVLADHPLGWLAMIALCAARPLFGFSSSLLSIAAGYLYGPALGFVVVTLGHQTGALVAYALARTLVANLAERALAHERLRSATAGLQRETFATVLTLRLAYVPFDAVNHAAGALRLRVAPFLAGSALGSALGSLTFLTFGASLGDLSASFDGRAPSIDTRALAASAVLLIVSLAAARLLRRKVAS